MDEAEVQLMAKELAAHDPSCAGDARAMLPAVLQLQNVVHVLAGRLLVEVHRTGVFAGDGAASGPNWAAARSGAHERELWARLRTASRLQQLPVAEAAAIDGELQERHQQQLADCVRHHPELALRADAILTQLAIDLSMSSSTLPSRYGVHWQMRTAKTALLKKNATPPHLNRARCG